MKQFYNTSLIGFILISSVLSAEFDEKVVPAYIVRIVFTSSGATCYGIMLSRNWVLTGSVRKCFNGLGINEIDPKWLTVYQKNNSRQITEIKSNMEDNDSYLDGFPEIGLLKIDEPLKLCPLRINTYPISKICEILSLTRGYETIEIYTFLYCQSQYNLVTWDGERCGLVKNQERPPVGAPIICGGALSALKTESTTIEEDNGRLAVDVIVPLYRFVPWIADVVDDLPAVGLEERLDENRPIEEDFVTSRTGHGTENLRCGIRKKLSTRGNGVTKVSCVGGEPKEGALSRSCKAVTVNVWITYLSIILLKN